MNDPGIPDTHENLANALLERPHLTLAGIRNGELDVVFGEDSVWMTINKRDLIELDSRGARNLAVFLVRNL